MQLTGPQLLVLKADILADPVMSTFPMTSDKDVEIAGLYNLTALPDYWVFRTLVPDSEIYETTTPAPDNTTWSWTIYIGRSQAERDAWRQMVNMKGGINPSLANARQGITDIFSGAGGLAQRTHITVLSRRLALRGEKLFATGLGTIASPSTMSLTAEGNVSQLEVAVARSLP